MAYNVDADIAGAAAVGREADNAQRLGLQWDAATQTYYDRTGRSYFPDQVRDLMAGGAPAPMTNGQGAIVPRGGAARVGGAGGGGLADLPQNPFELAAWMQLTNPGSGGVPYGDGGRNYWSSSNGLTDLFNQGATSIKTPHGTVTTAGGPYAQLQDAAVQTAPSRAARDIAEIQAAVDLDKNRGQREFASQLVSSLFGAGGIGGMGGRRTGLTTDYGAGVSMPAAPQHVAVNRFRPKSQAAALFN